MVSPHQEELTALARDVYDTLMHEDAVRSFEKTGKAVFKTTAHKVQVDGLMPKVKRSSILGVKPMEYIKKREKEVKI